MATLTLNQCLNPKVPHMRTFVHWNQYCLRNCITLNYHVQCLGLLPPSSLLQQKLHYTFFEYTLIFENNLIILHTKLVYDNDHKSYDVRQWVLMYSALLKLCTDELTDSKSQINQLTSQVSHILTTLDQPKDTSPKCNKRCETLII